MYSIPRNEHPRPDRQRDSWLCLNGKWNFEIDNAKVGVFKKFFERDKLDGEITLPFCPESKLSGVQHTDFMNSVWYRRNFDVPKEWANKRVIFHIDASDYETTLYINGKKVGSHRGGYTPFQFDITDFLCENGNYAVIYAEDDIRSDAQCSGKQAHTLHSQGCVYTRTTGIWQTVWLEAVEAAHVCSYRVLPNISDASVVLEVLTSKASVGGELEVSAFYEGKPMGSAKATVYSDVTPIHIDLAEKHLWECGCGRLYDLEFKLTQNGKSDLMKGYFGLREVSLTKENGLTINGETVFGRFVLDQGFYPDGICTAPSDDALVFDIEASMACGFNGARLHQKVFEPRFLYHADRLGYMVWDETGNWGLDHTRENNIYNFLPEWLEEVERDFSHPSVIGWCPFNETWDQQGRPQVNAFLDSIYDVTKAIDKTRPVITASGSYPTERTDVHDVHDYEQNPEKFYSYYSEIDKGIINDQLMRKNPERQISKPQLPLFVSEYGGIGFVTNKDHAISWSYGMGAKSDEEYFSRLEGLTDVLLENKHVFAYCYTQLTDVEQEQNGVLTYDRQFKFAPDKFKKIFGKKAAIEK